VGLSSPNVVALSRSYDTKNNPLHPEKKLEWAKLLFKGINFELATPEKPTWFHFLRQFAAEGYDDLIMVAGSDRVDEYWNKIEQYNGKEGEFTFQSARVVSAGVRDEDNPYSGTAIRDAIRNGEYDRHLGMLASSYLLLGYYNTVPFNQMYKEVREGMGLIP
jgi:hypothetical protein